MSTEPVDADQLDQDETEQILDEVQRRRSLRGLAVVAVSVIGIAFSAFQIWIAARGFTFSFGVPFTDVEYHFVSLQLLQVNAIHVAFALLLAFLFFPPSTGDGFVARRLGYVVPISRRRLGTDNPVTNVLDRVRGFARWAALDPHRVRVTPVDLVLMGVTLLTPIYMVREFDEIRRMRIRGIGAGRPINEVYPFLDPPVSALAALGIPLDEVSYAVIIAAIGVLLVLEATRRALSTFLMVLVALFIVYARWGYLIPRDVPGVGVLSIPPLAWESILRDLWFTDQGIFGVPVTVSVRFIYIFILFGAFLEMSGAGKWFIDVAYSLTGTRKGGPAKASVVSSGFMGMLSGSSIANTVTTGAFTIPLMKRSGYSPEFSGAVESSASSGGQILPPVMGAAAFLIVEFTQTPYREVIIAASIPAIAFFFGMWVMVHLQAVRQDIGGVPRDDLPNVRSHVVTGWFYLVPVFLLLYFLVVMRLSVARAGWLTIVSIVALIALIAAYDERTRVPLLGTILLVYAVQVVSYATVGTGITNALATGTANGGLPVGEATTAAASGLGTIVILVSLGFLLARPYADSPLLELDPSVDRTLASAGERLGSPRLVDAQPVRLGGFILRSMDAGARTATPVVIAVAAAGVIPGVISVSGLGPNLTSLIVQTAGGSLLALLLLTGVSAIILGLGMPTTVMYIILVAMLGPAIEVFGIALLAAHLFILYFGLMADVTPPVAVAAYAAAGVAKADEFATGIIAFLLSLNKILVPFAFVFSPGILLLRITDEGPRILGWSDVAALGYFVPEVVIPIVGMFLGVYALGVTIIGYYRAEISDVHRGLFAIASILLMVPALFLVAGDSLFGFFGIGTPLYTVFNDVLARGVGLVMLVTLLYVNRHGAERAESSAEATPQAE